MSAQPVFRTAGEGRAIEGLPICIRADGGDTRGAYSVVESTIPPGRRVPTHMHANEEEAWYIIEGEITFEIEGAKRAAPAGSFVLVPRGSAHGFSNETDSIARFLELFSPPGMERYFEERAQLASKADGDYAGVDPEAHALLAARYGMKFAE